MKETQQENEKNKDKILAFDTLFTTNQIQMYKILLSYITPTAQKQFAIYIKFMELQYTISFFQNHPYAVLKELPMEETPSSGKMIDEILPFCDNSQKGKLQQMKSMLQNFENMQEMMEMLQMMKELFPEGMGSMMGDGTFPPNGMDISQLFSMFGGNNSGNMSDMFDMFQAFQSSSDNNS